MLLKTFLWFSRRKLRVSSVHHVASAIIIILKFQRLRHKRKKNLIFKKNRLVTTATISMFPDHFRLSEAGTFLCFAYASMSDGARHMCKLYPGDKPTLSFPIEGPHSLHIQEQNDLWTQQEGKILGTHAFQTNLARKWQDLFCTTSQHWLKQKKEIGRRVLVDCFKSSDEWSSELKNPRDIHHYFHPDT